LYKNIKTQFKNVAVVVPKLIDLKIALTPVISGDKELQHW
jgi:hypothetical protein